MQMAMELTDLTMSKVNPMAYDLNLKGATPCA
jgi:hypothetical protein